MKLIKRIIERFSEMVYRMAGCQNTIMALSAQVIAQQSDIDSLITIMNDMKVQAGKNEERLKNSKRDREEMNMHLQQTRRDLKEALDKMQEHREKYAAATNQIAEDAEMISRLNAELNK